MCPVLKLLTVRNFYSVPQETPHILKHDLIFIRFSLLTDLNISYIQVSGLSFYTNFHNLFPNWPNVAQKFMTSFRNASWQPKSSSKFTSFKKFMRRRPDP